MNKAVNERIEVVLANMGSLTSKWGELEKKAMAADKERLDSISTLYSLNPAGQNGGPCQAGSGHGRGSG